MRPRRATAFPACALLAALIATGGTRSLAATDGTRNTFVDEHGVFRWTANRAEIAQFGVNYTAPFAYAFRAHQRLGIPIERAIDADVYHFARLGFDAYRVHIWDREISDADGNLLANEHLAAFDYLLAQLKRRGIKSILTPLQFGNAGYPEPGVPLPGFSSKYGKQGCLEDRASWPLQERYLAQLLNHVNPRTGVAYKDDPDILAFEICNEPGHFEYDLTVAYINTMVRAMRSTGYAKPIFYNMSHGIPVAQAYLDAEVQGGTFQWYPSNLVAGHEQRGNFLPAVDDYPIPFAGNPKFGTKAKIVYEFDAADIGRSYLYPAIARTFRKAGMQVATQFAYDPMFLAPYNTEYQTHYLNLAYSPQKALGMKVAGEAFRHVPLYKDYGAYPDNTTFAGVRVSYTEDLAEFVTDEKFFHSNTTASKPPAPEKLAHLAGCGNSPVVTYPGSGAYFLDRLEPGVWRLEVMPDAIWTRDPFEKPSPEKSVARIAWNEWPMQINLPDLGSGFAVTALNDGNTFKPRVDGNTLTVRPGAYLLTRVGVTAKSRRDDAWENITLKEFVAPPASLDRSYALHTALPEASAGEPFRVTAILASPHPVERAELVAYLPDSIPSAEQVPANPQRQQPGGGNTPGTGPQANGGALIFPMKQVSGLEYSAEIPGAQIKTGTLRYHIVVHGSDGVTTFPSQLRSLPADWNFYGDPWTTRIVAPKSPILLFDAGSDAAFITGDYRNARYELVSSDRPGISAMAFVVRDLHEKERDQSFRFYFKDKIRGRRSMLGDATTLVLHGKSASSDPCPLQLALVTADGIAYGGMVQVEPQSGRVSLPVSSLRQVRAPNIPHGYPVFIPFWSSVRSAVPLDLSRVESVLVSIGPDLPDNEPDHSRGVEIERIWLE